MMVLLGAAAFMMQDEARPPLTRLKENVVIRINRPQHGHRAHADGRKCAHIKQQPAPTGEQPEAQLALMDSGVHFSIGLGSTVSTIHSNRMTSNSDVAIWAQTDS